MIAEVPEVPATDKRLAWTIYACLAVSLIALLWTRETDPDASIAHAGQLGIDGFEYTPKLADAFYGVVAFTTGLGLLIHAWIRRFGFTETRWFARVARGVLVTLLILAASNWLYGTHGIAKRHYVKHYEVYHYLLGPKYYQELGYFGLYECTVLADAETLRYLTGQKIRDLDTYDFINTKRVKKSSRCRDQMSPERWEQFKHDYQEIARPAGRAVTRAAVRDYGYNGTPFHAQVAGAIANRFEISYASMTAFTLMDTLAICALMAMVASTFGFNLGSVLAILFFTAFWDRFVQIGGSFFRYHWLIFSGFGLIAMHRGRHALAGVLIALAAMLNVFPVLFVLGIGGKAAIELAKTRARPRPEHIRFTLACMGTAALCFGTSLLQTEGVLRWREFFADMTEHSQLVTTMRIGYRYLFLYRGELVAEDLDNAARTVELATLSPIVHGLTLLGIAVILYMLPRLSDVQATILAGFGTFYLALGTVQYYFGIFVFLVLLYAGHARDRWAQTILAIPLLWLGFAYTVWYRTEFKALCNNTLMSTMVMLGLSGAMLFLDAKSPGPSVWGSRFVRAGVAAMWLGALLTTWIRW